VDKKSDQIEKIQTEFKQLKQSHKIKKQALMTQEQSVQKKQEETDE